MTAHAGSSPSPTYHSLKPQSPRKPEQQEAHQDRTAAAPGRPAGQTPRIKAGSGYLSQPQTAETDPTSSHDATPKDSMQEQDDGDPHDLSFPKKHYPRASMVDNLVMSLDQFTPAADASRSHGPQTSAVRPKGHLKSPSVATETDLKDQILHEIPGAETALLNDGPKLQQVDQVPVILGEEEETQRDKYYNTQRAMQHGKPVPGRGNTWSKTRSDSNASSIDLSHLASYAGRLGAAGNRRSQSFDFGSTRPKILPDTNDMTPHAVAYQGSENFNALGINTSTAATVVRRNSGKAAGPNHSRKGRSGTVTAANTKIRIESPQPQLSTKSQTFDTSEARNSTVPQPDQSHAPRAGFFRRVFGSSNKSNMGPSSYPSPSRMSQDRPGSGADVRRPATPPMKTPKLASTDHSNNKENQPTISKKPSSFFRRRKKSVSNSVPPPLPLTLNNNLDSTKPDTGAPSPVSSLRAFMDPYLGDGTGIVSKHIRGSSLQSVQHVDDTAKGRVAHSKDSQKVSNGDTTPRNVSSPPLSSRTRDAMGPPLTIQTPSPANRAGEGPSRDDDDTKLGPGTSTTPGPTESRSTAPVKTVDTAAREPSSPVPAPVQPHPKSAVTGQLEEPELSEITPVKSSSVAPVLSQEPRSPIGMIKLVPRSSGSDTSEYKSAPSTPLASEMSDRKLGKSPAVHISRPSVSQKFDESDLAQARRIYENADEQLNSSNSCGWLGEVGPERERVRMAYMSLFDWTNFTILAGLRNLCSKLQLKGETQQVDRVLDAFALRWCECNPHHEFISADVVHTICYSILLLNTDLHLADITRKMTRAEFVRNAMDTIREHIDGPGPQQTDPGKLLAVRANSRNSHTAAAGHSTDRSTTSMSTTRPIESLSRENSYDESNKDQSGLAAEYPFPRPQNDRERQVEFVLREFYLSISKEPLPLFGSQPTTKSTPYQSTNNLSALATLRRTPSTISKSTSDTRGRYAGESRSLGARWASKTRSRPRLGTGQIFGSSRTSFDDHSSAWSPSMSSTWSRVSLNKTLTSMSVDSFGPESTAGGYQASVGFANALSQAIIRDEHMDGQIDDGIKAVPLLEDESLELYGAPWAKEGILKHKCHLDGVDKRSKDRNWNDCFAVIEKGWMRLFSFSMTAKSLRNKARNHKAGAVVGGGNWQDNAEEVWKFMLRHTIASSLPPPGYSKQRPYVWALSLPNGAVHLFSVGTPDIVKEFVSTANFWSARLSKEPMTGGISSMEYGWSDGVINRALVNPDSQRGFNASSPRPSTQLSMRSSMEHGGVRPRLPGDKVHISEWVPPQQSLMASQLLEIDQLKALQIYVKNIEDELQKHNEFRSPMLLAFSSRHPNSQKAMTNWEKKSSYLLREIVKFRTYMDALQSAQTTKEKVYKMREEEQGSLGPQLEPVLSNG